MAFSPSVLKDLRMMLVGHRGVGKSATANAIFGQETFQETETIQCVKQSGRVEGRHVSVIDTPGIDNPSLTTEQWRTELKKGLLLSSPGPHVFLLVTKVGGFSEEERKAVKWIKENFGEKALRYSMVLFIGREEITNKQWVTFSEDPRTKDLISCCGGRYCVINSKREVNPTQIIQLLMEIEAMVQQNGNQFYTQEMYEAVVQLRKTGVKQDKEKMREEHDSNPNPEGLISCCEDRHCLREVNSMQINRPLIDIETVQQIVQSYYTDRHMMTYEVGQLRKTVKQDKEQMTEGQKSNPKANHETCLAMQRDDAVIAIDVKCGNVKPLTKEEVTVKSFLERKAEKEKFVKENIRRQVETRREQEKKKWEEERKATASLQLNSVCDVRIVLIGGVGVGKSSSGNTILGREAFGNNIIKVNTMGKRQDGMMRNKSITVIDTVIKDYARGSVKDVITYNQNVFPHSFSNYCEELGQCLSMCKPGPHVFVLVIPSPNSFSFPVDLLYPRFGPEVLKRTLILITHGDRWGRDHRAVLNNSPVLRELIQNCGGDFHIFDNQEKEDRTQVTELMQKIEILIEKNGQGHCTTEMYNRKGSEAGSCSLI